MTIATSQSDFRSHMKDYMDSVVAENSPVYVVRGKRENTVVLSSQDIYNLLVDFANAKPDTADYAILRYKLVEAGIIKDNSQSYRSEDLPNYFERFKYGKTTV